MIQIVIYYGVAPPVIQELGVMLENFVIASDLHRLDVFTSAKSIYRRQSDSEVSLSMSPQCGTGTGYYLLCQTIASLTEFAVD